MPARLPGAARRFHAHHANSLATASIEDHDIENSQQGLTIWKSNTRRVRRVARKDKESRRGEESKEKSGNNWQKIRFERRPLPQQPCRQALWSLNSYPQFALGRTAKLFTHDLQDVHVLSSPWCKVSTQVWRLSNQQKATQSKISAAATNLFLPVTFFQHTK